MTREEIEREIAERLAAVLDEDATVHGNVGNWLAVAREVMVMMERVALSAYLRGHNDGKNHLPIKHYGTDLSPAVEDG